MTEKPPTLIRLRLDSVHTGICRADECGATIVWYRTLIDNHFMPMNAGALPQHVDGKVGYFDAAQSHWATCPARARFGKPRKVTT